MVRSVRSTRLEPCRPPSSFETRPSGAPQDEGGVKPTLRPPHFLRRGRAGVLISPPHKTRGAERREGASTFPRQRKQVYAVCATRLHLEARDTPCDRCVSPLGAPLRRFLSPGPCFRALGGELFALPSGAAFAAPRPCPSSHQRQPHVVGADGYPRPPGDVRAKHIRGRRASLHSHDAS